MEMNIDATNWVPVIYKTEIEPSSVSGLIPTIIIIGMHNTTCLVLSGRSFCLIFIDVLRLPGIHDA